MLTRLAHAATAVLALAAPIALAAPEAMASQASPVEPGTYQIVDAGGHCLRGTGGFNSKALVGACDTGWKVMPAGSRFRVTHTATGNCLAAALELMFPPLAATLPCDAIGSSSWIIADTGSGRVTISQEGRFGVLTSAGDGHFAIVVDRGADGQEWTLRRV